MLKVEGDRQHKADRSRTRQEATSFRERSSAKEIGKKCSRAVGTRLRGFLASTERGLSAQRVAARKRRRSFGVRIAAVSQRTLKFVVHPFLLGRRELGKVLVQQFHELLRGGFTAGVLSGHVQ